MKQIFLFAASMELDWQIHIFPASTIPPHLFSRFSEFEKGLKKEGVSGSAALNLSLHILTTLPLLEECTGWPSAHLDAQVNEPGKFGGTSQNVYLGDNRTPEYGMRVNKDERETAPEMQPCTAWSLNNMSVLSRQSPPLML